MTVMCLMPPATLSQANNAYNKLQQTHDFKLTLDELHYA
jgi:hypothetical protein